MEKITITRGLGELKLLDKRITKAITGIRFVDMYQERNRKDKDILTKNGVLKSEYEQKTKAAMESIYDLVERRKQIKSAILISNATTKIAISETEYTVIEAIERKNSITYEKNILAKMRADLTAAKSQIEAQKPQLDQGINEMVQKNIGDKKPEQSDYELIAKPFFEANVLRLIDPCQIEKEIEKLDEKIDNFLTEVDFVLSESNAKTEIEF